MIRRFLLVIACALALVVVVAAPAGAHAQLVETDPRSQAELETAPDAITLTFDEPVEASLGAIRLYDSSGDRIDTGSPEFPDGDHSRVRASVGDLAGGSYVVTWRVSSADGHPIQGAFTFQVGDASTDDVESLAARLLDEQGGDRVLGIAYGIDRFLVFASIALLLGGIGFLAWVAPAARSTASTRFLLTGSLVVCILATAAAVGLQGAYTAGLGLADAFDLSLIRDVLDTRFGRVMSLRLLLLGITAVLLLPLIGPRSRGSRLPTWWYVATTPVVIAIAATPGLAGHASSGRHILAAQITDTVHVIAMALWLGGLVFLTVAFLPSRDAEEAERPLTRFSRLALVCVALLVISGAFQSWRQVGSIAGLRETDYGKLLVLKVVLVGIMVIVAVVSRETVYRLYGPPVDPDDPDDLDPDDLDPDDLDPDDLDPDDLENTDVADDEPAVDERRELRRLRVSIGVEILFAIAVLAVTAALVNTPPALATLEGPVNEVVEVTDDLSWQLTVDPAVAGPNDIHLIASTTGGGPADPLEVTVTATYPDEDIGPLELPLRQSGPGHYLLFGFDLPIPGEWVIEIRTLVSPTQEETNEVRVQLR